ncbi:hypothetical protein HPP92_001590 [Vanilla planifolia]|uniref:DNA mismatch repair proteins mutS family domain-containing protein n=1 Tax=Vanilla planifolia TaxID=51239 RepID=A0A835VDP4_VANPL|nr:hypothetical protein HPP92_001590 [Vanilla planifolia]
MEGETQGEVLKAHGSFVPADAAIVGLTDRFYLVAEGKDTPLKVFLHATPRSLCVMDEFGKGTLTEDFAHVSCMQSEKIRTYTMSILRPDDRKDSVDDLIFLYRLVPGRALVSYGIHCARLAGVPQEVVERATSILESIQSDKPIVRLLNQKILAKDQQYKDAVNKLLAFDISKGDLNHFFQEIFPEEF